MAEANQPGNRKAAEYLAGQLERLMALSLVSPQDVGRWDRECAAPDRVVFEPHDLPDLIQQLGFGIGNN